MCIYREHSGKGTPTHTHTLLPDSASMLMATQEASKVGKKKTQKRPQDPSLVTDVSLKCAKTTCGLKSV